MTANKKKVMLIAPPRTVSHKFISLGRVACVPPLGLMYIAAELEVRGLEVRILDCLAGRLHEPGEVLPGFVKFGMPDSEILDEISRFKPDYIGVSSLFTIGHCDFVSLCKLIRDHFQVPLVAGGSHATAEWKRLLHEGFVDYVVLGEGEYTFSELLTNLENGADIQGVAGLAHMKNGEPTANLTRRYIHDLDRLPFPAYHLIDFLKYMTAGHAHGDVSANVRWASLITSRGCPHKCSFCFGPLMAGNKIRLRSVESVLDEVNFLKSEYQVEEIHIEDDNFAHERKRAIAILDALSALDLRLTFPNGLAAYALNNGDTIEALKRSQVVSLTVAIESGDRRILRDVMNKPITPDMAKRVVHNLKNNGINVKGFFILGMPGETVDSLTNTYRLIRELKLDWNAISVAAPLPGTELAKRCIENNFISAEFRSKPERIGFGESVIDTPHLNHNQVNKYAYYFNIFTNFINIHKLSDPNQWRRYTTYRSAMYDRVMKMVPTHKYAPISAARIKIKEAMLILTTQTDDYAGEMASLQAVDGTLRERQLRMLHHELDEMEGEIVLFD